MLFEELVIHNFGIYKGRHSIDLRPKSITRPIILFGALNGGGKTTFLDALQLVLYGKFARCSNRGALSYPDYLSRAINRYVEPAEGSGLELQFSHIAGGTTEVYRVIRTWRSTGKGLKEELEVLRNGTLDPVITDRWYEYVEEFIPSQISQLFFFDGEKIEALADKENSAELLRTGIHALLGLDLVEQLSKDLTVIESRRQRELATKDEQTKLQQLEKDIGGLQKKRKVVHDQAAKTTTDLDQIHRREEQIRVDFRRQGGGLLAKRETLEAERRATFERLKDAEAKLRELAAGTAPLLLVRDLIRMAEHQASEEHRAKLFDELRAELEVRDSALLEHLENVGTGRKTLNVVRDFQHQSIATRAKQADIDRYLHIDMSAFSNVKDNELDHLAETIDSHLKHTETIADTVARLDRQIASVPDPDALAGVTSRLEETQRSRDRARVTLEALKLELEKIDRELEARNSERIRHLERTANQVFVDSSNRRVLEHSARVRSTLALFKHAVASQHIRKLEALIAESFKALVRKSSLIDHVSIDLETYRLTLHQDTGEELPAERLSAGERQLLAVSILWGLAKASGRPLPTIIDTPLGRLDGTHRHNLINGYFPYASHQVILLSTDEEIDEIYVEQLEPATAQQYLISYDEKLKSSSISKGYFWSRQSCR